MEFENLNIYDLNESLLNDLLLKVKAGVLGNEGLPINLIFSKLLLSIEIGPSTFVRRIKRARKIGIRELFTIYVILINLLIEIYLKSKDIRYINCALKLRDLIPINFKLSGYLYKKFSIHSRRIDLLNQLLQIELTRISDSCPRTSIRVAKQFLDESILRSLPFAESEKSDNNNNNIFIFCPNYRSLYTLTVAEMLRRHGINISAIIVKKVFNISRIRNEISRDGVYWVLKKFFQRFVFRSFSEGQVDDQSLAHLNRLLGLQGLDISNWSKQYDINVIYTDNFNSKKIEDYLSKTSENLGVFTGGGLIRRNILDLFSRGIINCHGGILPAYRGLDVEKWAIIEDNYSAIGCCAHLMTEKVDAGPILFQYNTTPTLPTTIEKVGFNFEYPQCVVLASSVLAYISGRIELINQDWHDGRQFFYMHPSLVEIVKKRLLTPVLYGEN